MAARPTLLARGGALAALCAALASPESHSLPADALYRQTLPNGLTLVVVSDFRLPVVGAHLSIGVGSADETAAIHGISHLVEHLVVSGPAEGGWVVSRVERYGGRFNAGTLLDFTRFYLEIPAAHLGAALTAMAEAVRHPTTAPAVFERERRIVLDEIARRRATPRDETHRLIAESIRPDHPYHRMPAGTLEVVLGLEPATVRAWHARWYRPGNATLVLVGAVHPETARGFVEEALGDWRGDVPERAAPTGPLWTGWTQRGVPGRGALAQVALSFPAPAASDFPASVAMDLVVALLGRGTAARLPTRLQAERNLATAVDITYPSHRTAGHVTLLAECLPEHAAQVRDVLWGEMQRLRAHRVSPQELRVARARLRTQWYRSNRTVAERAATLGYYEAVGVGATRAREYLRTADSLTSAALHDLVQQWWGADRGVLVVLGPARALKAVVDTPWPPAGAAPGPWDRALATPPRAAAWPRAPASARMVRRTLPSGLTVLVYPTPGSRLATTQVLLGLPTADRRVMPAARLLLFQALGRGTTTRRGADLAAALDALGAELEMYSAEDRLAVSVTAPVETLPAATQLLADMVLHAALAPEEIEHVRGQLRGFLRQIGHDPFERAYAALWADLAPSERALPPRWPSAEALEAVTRDAVVRLHRRLVRPARLIVSVVGDVAPAAVLREVERWFSESQREAPWRPPRTTRRPRLNDDRQRRAVVLDMPRAALLLALVGPAPGTPDYRALEVLAAVLGGGLDSRLFRAVRQGAGLAYEVTARLEPIGSRSHFLVYFTLETAHLRAVERVAVQQVRDLLEAPPSADELARARNLLITQHLWVEQVPSVLALHLARAEYYGESPEAWSRYRAAVAQVSAAEVQRVARRYFDGYALSEGLPAPEDNYPALDSRR